MSIRSVLVLAFGLPTRRVQPSQCCSRETHPGEPEALQRLLRLLKPETTQIYRGAWYREKAIG